MGAGGGVEADGAEAGEAAGVGGSAVAVVGNSTLFEDLGSGKGAKIAESVSGVGFTGLTAAFGGLLDFATGCDCFGAGAATDAGGGAGVGAGGGGGCWALISSIFCRMASRARAIVSESARGGGGAAPALDPVSA